MEAVSSRGSTLPHPALLGENAVSKAYAWGQLLDDLLAKGLTTREIGGAMGFELSTRMVEFYRRGVQPLHWRGEALLNLWCATMKKQREQAPMAAVNPDGKARGSAMPMHKAAMLLPQWPVVQKVFEAPKKRRKKVEVAG